jgi:hypothetical protein
MSHLLTGNGGIEKSGNYSVDFIFTGNTSITIPTSGTLLTTTTPGLVTSVTGTTNQINVVTTLGNAVVSISPTYAGQSSINTIGTLTSILDVQNGQVFKRTVVAGIPYSVLPTDYLIAVTSTILGILKITLPNPTLVPAGTNYLIKDESGTASATRRIQVSVAGGFNINGSTTSNITTAYSSRGFYTNGTNKWFTI